MVSTLKFDPIDPADVDFFQFDFGDATQPRGPLLAPGDSILTAAISTSVLVMPPGGGTPAPLVAVGAVIGGTPDAPLSRVTTQVQPGGTIGAIYLLTCRITTASGRTLERSAQLAVQDL